MKLNIYHSSRLVDRMKDHLPSLYEKFTKNKIDYEVITSDYYTDAENSKNKISCRSLVIEDNSSKRFKVLDGFDKFGDDMHCGCFLSSNYLDFCLKSNYSQEYIDLKRIKNVEKCRLWTWTAGDPNTLHNLLPNLREIKPTNKRMYFRGKSWANRYNFMTELSESNIIDCFFKKTKTIDYYKEMRNYIISFSPTGKTYNCYREIESMGVGVPVLMWERPCTYYNNLIPNIHFISYSNLDDENHDKNRFDKEIIRNKFLEVYENVEFLEFINNNAMKWFDENASYEGWASLTYKLLEL